MTSTTRHAQPQDLPHEKRHNGRCALTPLPASRPLVDLLRFMGVEPDGSEAGQAFTIPLWQVHSGATLLLEGARATHVYVVRTGTFKLIKTAEDGYEQVLAFGGQGEVLGFEALCEDRQRIGAVALEDCIVYAIATRDVLLWRRQHPSLDHALQMALSRQLARSGEMTELMAAVSSEVRLARFIMWWSARMAAQGHSPRRLRLRMSRRDIASLLGMAHETVSRSFSTFVDCGLLSVANREVEIIDMERLKACTRNSRGLTDETPYRAAVGGRPAGLRPRSRSQAEPAALVN
jgi:CRP/FNR family transcriptional regulator